MGRMTHDGRSSAGTRRPGNSSARSASRRDPSPAGSSGTTASTSATVWPASSWPSSRWPAGRLARGEGHRQPQADRPGPVHCRGGLLARLRAGGDAEPDVASPPGRVDRGGIGLKLDVAAGLGERGRGGRRVVRLDDPDRPAPAGQDDGLAAEGPAAARREHPIGGGEGLLATGEGGLAGRQPGRGAVQAERPVDVGAPSDRGRGRRSRAAAAQNGPLRPTSTAKNGPRCGGSLPGEDPAVRRLLWVASSWA